MPSPKRQLGESRPRVIRPFTDRDELVETFEKTISGLPLEENKVLVFYGIGGIGKTSLREELSRRLDRDHPQVAWSVLDFETQTHRDVEGALSWLSKEQMTRKYRVMFPSFELALLQFWQKSRPHTPLRTVELPLLEESDVLADLIYIGADIPGVSIAAKSIRFGAKLHQHLKEWWTKNGQRLLSQMHDMTPTEIEEHLPAFWANDLKDHMLYKAPETSMHRKPLPVVLFIDAYESLWEGQRTEARFFARDKWVRELVAQLPEVLWVITGRDKLRWKEHKPAWENYLKQHRVDPLLENDCRMFLSSCGVTGEAIENAIVEGSKGVPFYLDVAVDTYVEIKGMENREPVVADFDGTPREVLDRFLRHLEEAEEETLKVLSVARFWDRSLFKLLIDEFKTGYPATALPKLCRFSFVQEEQVPATWTINPLMREGLQEHLDAELRGEVHKYLFDHYKQRIESLENTAIGDLHKAALIEAFHHGRHALSAEGLFAWFTTVEQIFSRAAMLQFLTPYYEVCTEVLEDSLGPKHPTTATSLNDLGFLLLRQGLYNEARPYLRRALEIRRKVLGEEDADTAESLHDLAVLLRAQGCYERAHSLHMRALRTREKVLGKEHIDTAESLNNLGFLKRERGSYKEAQQLYEKALKIREKVLGTGHIGTAESLTNLGFVLREQGLYEEAQGFYERALEIREDQLPEEHPDIATSLNNLGFLLLRQGLYNEARPYLRRALEIRRKVLGKEHPSTARVLSNLGTLLRNQRHYWKACTFYERALAIREKVLGKEHIVTSKTLNSLAVLKMEQVSLKESSYRETSYKEARSLLERALEIREKKLPAGHPDMEQIRQNLRILEGLELGLISHGGQTNVSGVNADEGGP